MKFGPISPGGQLMITKTTSILAVAALYFGAATLQMC